jgi:hypothetical protein
MNTSLEKLRDELLDEAWDEADRKLLTIGFNTCYSHMAARELEIMKNLISLKEYLGELTINQDPYSPTIVNVYIDPILEVLNNG